MTGFVPCCALARSGPPAAPSPDRYPELGRCRTDRVSIFIQNREFNLSAAQLVELAFAELDRKLNLAAKGGNRSK
jgi:hypothetical protein